MMSNVTDRQYPIGRFSFHEHYSGEELAQLIGVIEAAPKLYHDLVFNLDESQLGRSYRPGSWNIRQLIHHVADIQYLHYFRMKKALTEPDYQSPTLINMDAWAVTPDSLHAPVSDSLLLLQGVTPRYVHLAQSCSEEQLGLSYFHPVRQIWFNQKQALAISAWHLQHHLAHIQLALQG